ncbi:sulfatase [Pedobacter sp. SD-b]|uniref:Sulfatase n=1 Tax=Pedobacter segetis TaxID=2793069 RepID=A0ABS1BNF5_9SPHI|nr:sulfatase [Pedobacter segetis]MBK0384419.1 sulfatase [Pedobacter segetis]
MKKYLTIPLTALVLVACSSYVNIQSNKTTATEKVVDKNNVVAQPKKPNILIIFPDQLRRYSAGFWSETPYRQEAIGKPDPVITPNIDRLAKEGVVFTRCIANFPLCSPSRGMMLTGMYPEQTGIWNNCLVGRNESLKNDAKTITDVFYEAGYNTAYFGKCHWLKPVPVFDKNGNYMGTTDAPGGNYMNKYDTYVPPGTSRHSIQYFYQSVKDEHFNPHVYSSDPYAIDGKKDGEMYLPKIFSPKNEADKIVKYLQNTNSVRDVNKPFCMIWAINPPHSPFDDANTDMDMERKYYDKDKYPTIDSNLVVRKNADLKVANYARNYFANVSSIDQYIGVVLKELDKMGVLDNTIVLFSSDHGELLGSHHLTGKNHVETESLAVPMIIHWPKGIKSGINKSIFSTPDIMPTLMGLAGLTNQIPSTVQGVNFSSHLTNPKTATLKTPEAALIMLSNSRGVYNGRYTLSIKEGETKQIDEAFLYDNLKDPYQLIKIKLEDRATDAKQLLIQLGKLLKEKNDPWYQKKKFKEIIPYPSN